ncbi:MAG: cysteine--tRNA ligase [Firmicutes bacterium]|jgi:cysteinyl-tRNA synthetase|nr:cysteine--tRNA ligase [Bacillota bacterium]
MAIQIYNTLTRKKEPFVPRDPGHVSIYVCGITPYDQSHLGHAVPSIIWDAIRRFLEYQGYKVRLIQNFTDIDDKVIARSQATGENVSEICCRYADEYLEAMDALGVKRADLYPRVSQEIPAIIEMIEKLVEKGNAYVVDGDVYFDVTSFPDYGKLSGQQLEELEAGARLAVDERKRHSMDFALWKSAKPGEPAWDSPWGKGRPGWHIECSAMSLKYLGNSFDLHGGGVDLVFPHHENEIAQSEAFTGEPPFARCWVHNGLLQVRDEKMSKSLGNFTPLVELLAKYPAGVIRFYVLSSHYRSPLQYSEEKLEEARRGWERLMDSVKNLKHLLASLEKSGGPEGEGLSTEDIDAPAIRQLKAAVDAARAKFIAAMEDDFNTAAAIAALFELARSVNTFQGQMAGMADAEQQQSLPVLREAAAVFQELGGDVLGLLEADSSTSHAQQLAESLLDLLVQLRQQARDKKDWAAADFIRDELARLGVKLEDSPLGTRWKL